MSKQQRAQGRSNKRATNDERKEGATSRKKRRVTRVMFDSDETPSYDSRARDKETNDMVHLFTRENAAFARWFTGNPWTPFTSIV
jgi:hypothetical protein